MIAKAFGTYRAVVSLKHSQIKELTKRKKSKGDKKSKQKMTVDFLVNVDRGKVGKPIVIRKSRKPRCFGKGNAAEKRDQVSYF